MLPIGFSLMPLITALLLFAAVPPYVSEGFVHLPSNVVIGAMSAVEVDRQGRVYVLHRGASPVLVFAPGGAYSHGFGDGLFKVAHGLRVDRDGNVWTTDNGNHVLRKFSPAGKLLLTIGEVEVPGADSGHFRSPDDVVFSSKGELFVADSGNARIVKLTSGGRFLKAWGRKGKGPSEFATAHGLAIDSRDRVYVADRNNNRVQIFDADGAFLSEWTGFGNPFGLLWVGGELLVSEGEAHKIIHLDRDGKVANSWGGPETLQLPHIMAVDASGGRLYVAEVDGKRVQIFRKR